MARVLLVDDEADILQALKMLIEDELGFDVVTCQDARTALNLIADADLRAVVSDYRMPGMDGLTFLTAVHARNPGLATGMMTAYADPDLERAAVEQAGVAFFVPKPIDLDAFVTLVRDVAAA
jgi:DNA-binding NtrC family response regulator